MQNNIRHYQDDEIRLEIIKTLLVKHSLKDVAVMIKSGELTVLETYVRGGAGLVDANEILLKHAAQSNKEPQPQPLNLNLDGHK